MESAEEKRASSQRRISFESESIPDPRRKQGRSVRWLITLAAALLIACLLGGVFLYARSQATKVITNHTGWCVSSGVVQSGTRELFHLTAISPTNIWAFGSFASGNAGLIRFLPLFEHWNGQRWNRVSFPNPSYGGLSDVASVEGKLWVVGESTDSTGQSSRVLIKSMC